MQHLSVNGPERQLEWQAIHWPAAYKVVRNLRQRIFRATQKGDFNKVRSLQKLMLRSHSNLVTSVRRVTQENAGKHTAGIDKVIVKTPKAREELIKDLKSNTPWKAKPARRVYIPKANGKLRPLGIPVIKDRCLQAIVKNALEPSWEARFEGSSYGFRPGRSAHDAIVRVHLIARSNTRKSWVVDADIKGAFDNISHSYLMETLGKIPARELIRQWLKAGYMDEGIRYETLAGTPQGGIISPLLANIALDGMEKALTMYKMQKNGKTIISNEGIKYNYKGHAIGKRAIVRYADDFLIFCESKQDAEQVQKVIAQWLLERGLILSEEKTKIVHLQEGFNFLGFNVRQYPLINAKAGKKLLIKPSKESVQRLRDKLKAEWHLFNGQEVDRIIQKLNPIIRGWANYFRVGVASKVFKKIDSWMYVRQFHYAKRMHPKKSLKWRQERYWDMLNLDRGDQWVFGNTRTGRHLLKFSWFPIERHILVKGNSSPDDAQLKGYWQERERAKIKDLKFSKQRLAYKQNGLCRVCRQSLFNGEEIHVHHKVPRSQRENNHYSNLELVHLFCHQQVHAK
jgi:RNA-directed DNA polymerase